MSYLEREDDERRLAVEALVDQFGRDVLASLYDAVRDRDKAEELFVRTYLQAYRKYRRKRRFRDHQTWLLRIAAEVRRADLVASNHGKSASETDSEDTEDGELTHSGQKRQAALQSEIVDSTAVATDEGPVQVSGEVHISSDLRLRLSQLLTATAAQVRAEKGHRGPMWIGFAGVATFIFAAAAIAVGSYHPSAAKSIPAPHPPTVGTEALPTALRNLPVTAVAQFLLSDKETTMAVDHFVAADNALFVPTLTTKNGKSIIHLDRCAFRDSGQPFSKVLQSVGDLPLIQPVSGLGHKPATTLSPWQLSDWRVVVTKNWVVATVTWSKLHLQNSRTIQLYALYLPNGRSALVRTLRQNTGFADRFATAVGDGRVIIQSGFTNPTAGGSESIVSLPIEVYQLQGSDPLYALGKVQNIRAPFGLMVQPAITGDRLVFQGLAGQPDEPNAPSAAWYDVSWSGQLTKWWGPPVDGQPHWPVKGTDGTLYWVETTPDMRNEQNVQVLMNPLSQVASAAQSPATTLSSSVPAFTVSGQSLVWIQTQGGAPQVVVAKVN